MPITYTYEKANYRNDHLNMVGENIEESFSRNSQLFFIKDQEPININLDEKDKDFLSFFEGGFIKTDSYIFDNVGVFFFNKDGKSILIWNKSFNHFRFNFDIWSFFESKYSLNYMEVKRLVNHLLEKHLKMKGVTTGQKTPFTFDLVENHFKMKGVTTWRRRRRVRRSVEKHFKMKGVTTYPDG